MATKLPITSRSSCPRCVGALLSRRALPALPRRRYYSDRSTSNVKPEAAQKPAPEKHSEKTGNTTGPTNDHAAEDVKGAMSRRLQEATEEALFTGGTSGRRAIEEAGFSEELKEKLLDKVKTAQFRKQYAGAIATAELSSTSRGSGAFDASEPWAGSESQSDAVLRMLDDAKKPLAPELRGKYKVPNPVDLRPRAAPRVSASQRIADARDKAGMYSGMNVKDQRGAKEAVVDDEKEERRRALRERFEPHARAVPATVSGMTALANQRIDEAIARGAFRDIPRGKDAAPRDRRSDNPFIDTTEYLMNNMIQRQQIVPPWIEKQQDVTKTANVFRSRLRNDWRRHAARMIASKGGALEEQVRKAEGYAMAEARMNPLHRGPVSEGVSEDLVLAKVREGAAAAELTELADLAAAAVAAEANADAAGAAEPTLDEQNKSDDGQQQVANPYAGTLFRDPAWVETEKAYLNMAIDNLNSLTRSYNLMAPELARKPYFSLERELKACYADVAPLVAGTIRERATRPARSLTAGDGEGVAKGTVFDRFGNEGGAAAKVYDSRAPHYGIKEMWRDFWKRG